jgi:hypothetical protein
MFAIACVVSVVVIIVLAALILARAAQIGDEKEERAIMQIVADHAREEMYQDE